MAHVIETGPLPNIKILKLYDNLNFADMTVDDELGLNEGTPLYVLLDGGEMDVGLPPDFLNGAKQSFFVNQNLVHMSVYLESSLLRTVAQMVAKLTGRREKLTLHDTRQAALNHLVAMAQTEKVTWAGYWSGLSSAMCG